MKKRAESKAEPQASRRRLDQLVRLDIFGYFDKPESDVPAHDPCMAAPCIVCMRLLSAPVMTISLTPIGNERSYFFRVHKDCWLSCSSEEKTKYESSLIDYLCHEPDCAIALNARHGCSCKSNPTENRAAHLVCGTVPTVVGHS